MVEECGRCNGHGEYTVRLGEPGTDVRKVGVGNVKWRKFGPFPCAVCSGSGMRKAKRPIVGRFRIAPD